MNGYFIFNLGLALLNLVMLIFLIIKDKPSNVILLTFLLVVWCLFAASVTYKKDKE